MMFRIEFSGKLLNGFDPQFVRLEVGVRLRLRDAQVERMFSGQTVVLKKALAEENCAAYMAELRSIGLDASFVPLEMDEPVKGEATEYKVVYWGKVLPGFERTAVMAAAVKQLRVPPAQLIQTFSGAKVVLKRGISAEQGARLVVQLALIGMQIELEVDTPVSTLAVAPTPQGVPMLPAAGLQEDDPQYGALLRTACDLSGTAFSGYDTSSAFARDDDQPSPVAPSLPPVRLGAAKTGGGFAAANTDGYLNCPRCGLYQAYAMTCSKCGVELPKPRSYVGRSERFVEIAPTTVVNQAEPWSPQEKAPAPPPAKAESLRSQMRKQAVQEQEKSTFPYAQIAGALLVLAGVVYLLISR